ncbi:hypothetical protein O6H91_23G047000 [Diphasiastrum complanatum]|uniref:Uncharacterized protein n=1 Tax=Diphasiastrum complanatum TaxID=34168 RepID=A0ACC2ABN8_DIPCM|nr:hypothetical protein O6H91_23G047000 [Diphasiastrum complanatum]
MSVWVWKSKLDQRLLNPQPSKVLLIYKCDLMMVFQSVVSVAGVMVCVFYVAVVVLCKDWGILDRTRGIRVGNLRAVISFSALDCLLKGFLVKNFGLRKINR